MVTSKKGNGHYHCTGDYHAFNYHAIIVHKLKFVSKIDLQLSFAKDCLVARAIFFCYFLWCAVGIPGIGAPLIESRRLYLFVDMLLQPLREQ
ncbi:unnamed protein product [Camellia sinensis]